MQSGCLTSEAPTSKIAENLKPSSTEPDLTTPKSSTPSSIALYSRHALATGLPLRSGCRPPADYGPRRESRPPHLRRRRRSPRSQGPDCCLRRRWHLRHRSGTPSPSPEALLVESDGSIDSSGFACWALQVAGREKGAWLTVCVNF